MTLEGRVLSFKKTIKGLEGLAKNFLLTGAFILGALNFYSCGGGGGSNTRQPEPTPNKPTFSAQVHYNPGEEKSARIQTPEGEVEIKLYENSFDNPTDIKIESVEIPELDEFEVATPLNVTINKSGEENYLKIRSSALTFSFVPKTAGNYDIVKIENGKVYFGWAPVQGGRVMKDIPNSNGVYAVVDLDKMARSVSSTSTHNKTLSTPRKFFPLVDEDYTGLKYRNASDINKDIQIIFVHGLDSLHDPLYRPHNSPNFFDPFTGITKPYYFYTDHWWNYADPTGKGRDAEAILSKVPPTARQDIALGWFFYDSVHYPIFGAGGSGEKLAREIDSVISRNPDVNIILVGTSMGALVSRSAYDWLSKMNEEDNIAGMITLNGVNRGTEWVNYALTRPTIFFFGVPRMPGPIDLRSIYDIEIPDLKREYNGKVELKVIRTNNANTTLKQIINAHQDFWNSDRFIKIGSKTSDIFDFLTSDFVFSRINKIIDGNKSVLVKDSFLFASESFPLHDGIVPTGSQFDVDLEDTTYDDIGNTTTRKWHPYNHFDVLNYHSDIDEILKNAIAHLVDKVYSPPSPSPSNEGPIAILTADPISGRVPLQVTFDASKSYDPDGGSIVKFEWDWENDGHYDYVSSQGIVRHTFTQPGTYITKVRVTDDEGSTSTDLERITASQPSPPPNQSLDRRLYLSFDDPSNPGYNSEGPDGYVRGGALVDGIKGYALELQWNEDVRISSYSDVSALGSMSVEAWIKPYEYGGSIIRKWGDLGNIDDEYVLHFTQDNLRFVFEGSDTYIEIPRNYIELNDWNYVAVTLEEEKELRMYVNGQLVKSRTVYEGQNNRTREEVVIGHNFEGVIDEISVWKGVLSESEVLEHFNRYR